MSRWHVLLILAVVASRAVGEEDAKTGAGSQIEERLSEYQRKGPLRGEIVVIGSDNMNNLMTLWAHEFRKHHPDVEVSLRGKGSMTAPPALIAGTCDLGTMSRPMKDDEVAKFKDKYGYEPSFVPVALDNLAVFVHRDNPVEKLSLEEVDAIFGKERQRGHATDIATWGQVGLKGEWQDRRINLYGKNSASGPYGFFKERALAKGSYKDAVKELPGISTIVHAVASDLGAIGYGGSGYGTPAVRAVPLCEKAGDEAFAPTLENCRHGKYPLTRHLYIYFNRKPGKDLRPVVREFLTFIHSRQGQEVVLKDTYLPLDAEAVNRYADRYRQRPARRHRL